MRLQEQNARAAQEWFASSVRLLQLQQRNAEFAQDWTGNAVKALRQQTEHNLRTAEAFARGISKQQEGFAGAARPGLEPTGISSPPSRTSVRA